MRLPLSTAIEDAEDQLGTDPDVIRRVLARVKNPEYRALIDYYSRTEDDPVEIASRVLKHETRGDLSLPAGARVKPQGLSAALATGTRKMRKVRAGELGGLEDFSRRGKRRLQQWIFERPQATVEEFTSAFLKIWPGANQKQLTLAYEDIRGTPAFQRVSGAPPQRMPSPVKEAVRGAVVGIPEAGRALARTLPFVGPLAERVVGPPPTPEQAGMELQARMFNLPLEIVTGAAAEGATLVTIGAQLKRYGVAAKRIPQAAKALSEAGRRWRVAGEVVRDSRIGRGLLHIGQIFKPRGYVPSAVIAGKVKEVAPSVVGWTQDTQNLWQRNITARVDPEEHPQLHAFLRDIPQEMILLPGGVMGFKANIINAAARGKPKAVAEIAEGFTGPFIGRMETVEEATKRALDAYDAGEPGSLAAARKARAGKPERKRLSPVEVFKLNPAGSAVMLALIPGIYAVRTLRELGPRDRAVVEEVIARGQKLPPETPLDARMQFLEQEFRALLADPERVRAAITTRPPGAERARPVTPGPRPAEEARAILPREVEPGRARGAAVERETLIRRPEAPEEVPPEVAPPAPERPAPEVAEPFGSRNRVVSIEDAEAVRARLRQERRYGGGPSAEELADYARLGTFYLEGGIREFPEWSTRMVDELGEGVRPHLEGLWKQARAAVPPPTEPFRPGTAEAAEFGRAGEGAAPEGGVPGPVARVTPEEARILRGAEERRAAEAQADVQEAERRRLVVEEPPVTPTRPPEAPTPPAEAAPEAAPGRRPTLRIKKGAGEPFDVKEVTSQRASWVASDGTTVTGSGHAEILLSKSFTGLRGAVSAENATAQGFMRVGRGPTDSSGRSEVGIELESSFLSAHRDRILAITDMATEQRPVFLNITEGGLRTKPWTVRITSFEEGERVLREAEAEARFGERNTIVGQERAEQARTRLRKPKRYGGGPSTEELADWTTLGTFYLEGGIRDFPEWSRRMSGELGERVRPHLRAIWREAQKAAPVPAVDPAVDVISRRIATVEEAEALAQPKRKLVKGVTKVTRQLGDELVALREAVKDRGIRPSEDPYITLRLETTTAGGRIEQALGTGRTKGWFTDRGERVGESLTQIQDIATSKGKSIDDFRAYLTALDARGELAKGRKTPWTPEEVEAGIAALETPEFQRASLEFQRYNDHLRRLLENEAQVVPPGWSDAMAEKYPDYVPMIRVRGEAPAERLPTAARLGAPQPVRPRKGSELAIVDPLAITARRTAAYHTLGERMKARRQLADLADQPDTEWFIRRLPPETIKQADVDKMALSLAEELQVPASSDAVLETLGRMLNDATLWDQMVGASTRGRVLSVWREGKVELHEIHPDLVPVFSRANTGQAQWWTQALRMPATVVRATSTTLSPKFWALRNPSRDLLTGYIQSPGYSGYVEGLIRGLYSIVNRTPPEAVFVRAGGKQGAITALTQEPGALIDAVTQGEHMAGTGLSWAKGAWGKGRRLYEVAGAPGSMIENIPRFGVFIKGLKRHLREGMEYEDALRLAAMEAREGTVPFERKGVTTKQLNPYVAFLNARVQGPYTMLQAMRNRPVESFVKGTAVITVPTMIYYLHNRDDPDWQNLPAYRKYGGWNIRVGEDEKGETEFFWVPVPWEWGLVFGMGPMAALEAIRNDDPETWRDLKEVAITQFSPTGDDPTDVLPNVVDPMIHAWANRDWRGRPIVPERLTDVAPELQGTAITSEVAWRLGKLTKYPPAKIDALMTGYGGTLSRDVLAVIDQVMEGKGMRPGEARGFMRGVLVKASTSGASVDRFYNERAKLKEKKSLADAGRQIITKQDDERLQEAEGLARTLATIRADKREIVEDTELSPEQKLAEIDKRVALEVYLTTKFTKRPTPTWASRLSENGKLQTTRPTRRPTRQRRRQR